VEASAPQNPPGEEQKRERQGTGTLDLTLYPAALFIADANPSGKEKLNQLATAHAYTLPNRCAAGPASP